MGKELRMFGDTTYIAFDIETVATERAEKYVDKKHYKAPSNYKDLEKIEAYKEAEKLKDKKKLALHWWTGQVLSIACHPVGTDEKPTFFFNKRFDEKSILRDFFTYMALMRKKYVSIVMIGKNSEDFDRPFVIGRALHHKLGIPIEWQQAYAIKDVDHIFSRSRSCGQIGKLTDYAFGINMTGKTSEGSKVADMYNRMLLGDEEAAEELEEYNIQDALIVSEMVRRYQKVFEEDPDYIPESYKLPKPTKEPMTEEEIPF